MIDMSSSEQIVRDVAASMRRGIETVGGRLLITNKRLLFQAHALNIQKLPAEIPYNNISEIRRFKNLGIVNNGASIILNSGMEYKFILNKTGEIIKIINELLDASRKGEYQKDK